MLKDISVHLATGVEDDAAVDYGTSRQAGNVLLPQPRWRRIC